MDYKKHIKEYYSAMTDKTEKYSGELPYSPEEELLKIKAEIKARGKKKIISFAAAAAAVAVLAVGVSVGRLNRDSEIEVVKNTEKTEKKEELSVARVTDKPELETRGIMVADASDAEEVGKSEASLPEKSAVIEEIPEYTMVPRITVPPMETSSYDSVDTYNAPADNRESYELGVYYALSSTPMPEIEISENENIPSGSAMMASDGSGGENSGILWSEEEYFSYLGKNPLEGLNIPSDLVKSESEEKYMLRDENGILVSDSRTFSYANEDRTRLLNITTSKFPISDIEYESTDINGIRVSVFDNHMSNTALLGGNGLYISAEMYGLEEEELMSIVYSLAERMAL